MIPSLLTALIAMFNAVGKLFEFLYAKRLADAGKVQEQLAALQKQVQDAQIAVAAREAVRAGADADGLPDDPFRRD